MKSIGVFGCLIVLSGCITIEAPKNLVSDTVKASKELYDSVKGKDEKSANEGINQDTLSSYSASYDVPDNESLAVSTAKCIDSAIEQARKALNQYNIEVKQTDSNMTVVDGKSILVCNISV